MIHVVGAETTSKLFFASSVAIPKTLRQTVRHHGQLLLTRIRANASGRPGPNAPTGDYRRSWTLRTGGTPASSFAEVGTNKPQGRRLEYGFVGADSLGRVYNQPPFPHVGPARDWVEPQFVAAMEAGVRRVL